jgi:hypothetical protein
MPIIGVPEQPFVESIHAAYRPIIFIAYARRTDGELVPPVVYCDIYVRGVYYKTISQTQYYELTGTESKWRFDIQDALQEYLDKYIFDNGTIDITEVTDLIADVFCKFRSSGYDPNGFILPEGVVPIQGTSSSDPVPGTGTPTNTFYVINASLQHEDNQDLAQHLNAYKHRTWAAGSYPLTHRPEYYKLCKNDSDSFPIVTDKVPGKLVLHYMLKNSAIWQTSDFNAPCDPLVILIPDPPGFVELPDGVLGIPYSYSLPVGGSMPATLTGVTKPTWMTIAFVGSNLVFSGTPDATVVNAPVLFTINSCFGNAEDIVLDVTVACQNISFLGSLPLPDAVEGVPYNVVLPFGGSRPLTLTGINIPAWLTLLVIDGSVHLFGTANSGDLGNDQTVQFTVNGQCGAPIAINELIDAVSASSLDYADITKYSVSAVVKSDICHIAFNIDRTGSAQASAIAAGKSVRIEWHVIADNGCEFYGLITFLPADLFKSDATNLICGTGGCTSAVVSIVSLTVL